MSDSTDKQTHAAIGRPALHRSAAVSALLLLGVAFGGCTSLPPNLAADGTITIDRVDSRDARIGQVLVGEVDGGLRVSGDLRKTYLRRGRIPGHLHLVAVSADGSVLNDVQTGYMRRSVKSGRAFFSQVLPVTSSAVHRVRVVHHGLGDRQG